LKTWFPSTSFPFIASAPMFGVAKGTLASAVTKVGGFGFIGAGFDLSPNSAQLAAVSSELSRTREILALPSSDPLPVGIGFITFHPSAATTSSLASVTPILEEHKPLAIWLFAPSAADVHTALIPGLKSIGSAWGLKVFVQTGNVEAARAAVRDGADVIVAQGSDAGGHQFKRSVGFACLVPEVVEAVEEEKGEREVAVIAAGGIVEGRGVAAALAAGAGGVVMGTRFVVSDEAGTPEWRKKLLVETKDGSQSTVKTAFFDELPGHNIWPSPFDGRAVVNQPYQEHLNGMPMQESTELYNASINGGDGQRASIWAGAGVGLIKSIEPAGDIVR
ncbi:inosine monophosphate dehydrogenase, partial [Eremomyces bilateralis CBS 781.70]